MSRLCIDDKGHKYGIWNLPVGSKDAVRTCEKCGVVEKIPFNDDIFNEMIKQDEARRLFEGFMMMPIEDSNLIGSLIVIFDDVFNYLEIKQKRDLVVKLGQIIMSNFVSEENKQYIAKFMSLTVNYNFDDYNDNLDSFKNFNSDITFVNTVRHRLG